MKSTIVLFQSVFCWSVLLKKDMWHSPCLLKILFRAVKSLLAALRCGLERCKLLLQLQGLLLVLLPAHPKKMMLFLALAQKRKERE